MSKTTDCGFVCPVLLMSTSGNISVFVEPSRSQVRNRLPLLSLPQQLKPRLSLLQAMEGPGSELVEETHMLWLKGAWFL